MSLTFDWNVRSVIHVFKGASLHVLLALLAHQNQRGRCWPSNDLLMRETGYKSAAITKAIQYLEEIKAIVKVPYEHRVGKETSLHQRKNIYQITGVLMHNELIYPYLLMTPETVLSIVDELELLGKYSLCEYLKSEYSLSEHEVNTIYKGDTSIKDSAQAQESGNHDVGAPKETCLTCGNPLVQKKRFGELAWYCNECKVYTNDAAQSLCKPAPPSQLDCVAIPISNIHLICQYQEIPCEFRTLPDNTCLKLKCVYPDTLDDTAKDNTNVSLSTPSWWTARHASILRACSDNGKYIRSTHISDDLKYCTELVEGGYLKAGQMNNGHKRIDSYGLAELGKHVLEQLATLKPVVNLQATAQEEKRKLHNPELGIGMAGSPGTLLVKDKGKKAERDIECPEDVLPYAPTICHVFYGVNTWNDVKLASDRKFIIKTVNQLRKAYTPDELDFVFLQWLPKQEWVNTSLGAFVNGKGHIQRALSERKQSTNAANSYGILIED